MANERDLSGGRRCFTQIISINFASTGTLALSTGVDVPFTGARIGDLVRIAPSGTTAPTAGYFFKGYVSATDVVTVYFDNQTAGTVDLAATFFVIEVTGTEPVGGPQ